jgi:hypothetical protein
VLREARALLSSTGKIRKKENEGHYHFFSEAELSVIMNEAGARNIQIFRTFGNQVNLAVGEK